MDWLMRLRQSLRQMSKNPGLFGMVVLCLGICIGANTAVFTLLNELFLQPLPVEEPSRLVRLYTSQKNGSPWGSFSYPDYKDFRTADSVLSGLAIERPTPLGFSLEGANERIWGAVVSENYFSVLGVRPVLGTAFEDREFASLVLLSHGFWRSRFGGDPSIVGKNVTLNGHPFTVIGIAPPDFHGTAVGFSPQVWAPVTMQGQLIPGGDLLNARGSRSFLAIGRLQPGVTLEQAQTPLASLASRLATDHPDTNSGLGVTVIPAGSGNLYPPIRQASMPFVLVLQVMAGLVLVVACANIATLLLSRATGRQREIAVQLALGASRGNLVRQLLLESLILAFLGGIAGCLIAVWLGQAVRSFNPIPDLPVSLQLRLDHRVLAFNLIASLAAGLLFGMAPALQSTRLRLVSSLVNGTTGGGSRSRLRSALIVAQVALSVVLLVVAGLFARGLQEAKAIDPGFKVDGVVIASIDVGVQGYDRAKGEQFFRQLLERLRALPETRAASVAETPPLNLFNRQTAIFPRGFEVPEGGTPPIVEYNVVTPEYFQTLQISLAAGRSFNDRDVDGAARVVVVNQELADRYWPNQPPVGQRLETKGEEWEVVGVVETGKYTSLAEAPRPYLYLPFYQFYEPNMVVHVRSAAPLAMAQALRGQVRELDPDLPVFGARTLADQLGMALLPARLGAVLLSVFGLLALLLAAVGLYGALAYLVTQRRREVGIRMALGADGRKVLWLVIRQGMRLAAIGLVLGLGGALAASGLLTGLLFGLSPFDPITFVTVSAFLLAVAALACYVPARRAIRVDPAIALRPS